MVPPGSTFSIRSHVCSIQVLTRRDCLGRWDLWQPGLGVVDITNPKAREWYESKLDALVDLGVDTFKVRHHAIPLSAHDILT